MATYKVTDPATGQTVKLTGDSPPTEAELNEIFKSIPIQKQAPQTISSSLKPTLNPMELVAKGAPSNLMKLMGVAGANAPSATNLILNSMPGIGQPSRITSDIQQLSKNPGQVLQAIKRVNAVQAGSDLTPIEKTPAMMGKVAGTALEVLGQPSLLLNEIKATGPFTAGLKAPGTAIPGSFEQAGKELGVAKIAARTGENAQDATRFRVLLSKPAGISKVAEEGKALMDAGKDAPTTNLLAYREALGKMQAEGGTFAHDYKMAYDKASEMLTQKAPDLMKKLENMATNYAARGNPKSSFPWFTFALNPEVGLAKAALLPEVRNTAGAMISPLMKRVPAISSISSPLIKPLPNPVISEDQLKEFLKKFKGNKEKTRAAVTAAGFTIPGIGQ